MLNQPVENNTAAKDSRLPGFMSEQSKANYSNDADHSWFDNNLHRLMLWISMAWFAIVLIYITQFFGWSNLFLMMPDEFGGFLAGITLPLAVIWVVVAYIDRGSNFKQETRLLRTYMNNLVYPDKNGADTAQALAEAIRSQVQELQEVTRQATEQTEIIKSSLSGQVEDFARLVGALDNYSSRSLVEMTEGIKTLVKSFDYVVDKANLSTENFKSQVSEFSNHEIILQNNISELFGKLSPQLSELKSASTLLKTVSEDNNNRMLRANELMVEFNERAVKNVNYISETVEEQSNRLNSAAQLAVANTDKIYQAIGKGVADLGNVLKSQTGFAMNYVGVLDKNVESLSQKFTEQGEVLGLEVEKIIARTNAISESINTQVGELHDVSENVVSDLQNVEEQISSGISTLSAGKEEVATQMSELFKEMDEKNRKFSEILDSSVNQTNEAVSTLGERGSDIRKISESVETAIAKVSAGLVEKASEMRLHSDSSIAKISEVGEVMQKYAAGITEASSIVETQSRVSEASLAQQQRSITTSVTRLEEIKSELKRQVDELLKTAAVIDDNAAASVVKLKNEMENALRSCEGVIAKTQGINSNLERQRNVFDDETTKTLAKASQFEDILNNQISKLGTVTSDIEKRAENISNLMDKQISAVENTTARSDKSISAAVSSFEKQNDILQSVTENTLNHVSTVVQVLDEKAAAINTLFKNQEDEFFDICEKISENTNNIGASLKKQVSVIEQSSDRVFSRMGMLEENFSKHVTNIIDNSNKSIEKLFEIDKAVNEQSQKVTGYMGDLAGKISEISGTFKTNIDTFKDEVKLISAEAGSAAENIIEKSKKLQNAHSQIGEESRKASELLDAHSKNLENSLTKVQVQSDVIKDTLERQRESLSDIANVVSTQSRLGESSIAQQYKMLSDASVEVARKMSEINAQFKENTDNITENTTQIAYQFDVLSDKILNIGEDVSKASKLSIKNIEQVNLSLNQTADDLDVCVNKSVGKIGNTAKEYEKYIANFNTVTAEASTGVVEINNLIAEQSAKMLNISNDTKKLVDCFNTVLNDTSLELSKRANEAFDKVKGLGRSLKDLSIQVGETTKMSTIHMENSSDKIRSTISEVATNAERISNEIRGSGEVFLQQSNVLVAVSEETIGKITNALNTLTASSIEFEANGEKILQRSTGFNELFKKQMKILLETSQKAEDKLESLEKLYQNVNLDSFLKDASYVVEKLQNMAVDMNRIFNPGVEEELWKKYYNGDSGAFVRHLSKTMTKQQITAVRSEFEKNMEFRTFVSRYLTDFETLISQAKNNERSGILLSIISGADVGKLYFILARALDKLN